MLRKLLLSTVFTSTAALGQTITGPQPQTVGAGSTATFTASGFNAPCQWNKNDSPISGATDCHTYTTPVLGTIDNGSKFSITGTTADALLTVNSGIAPTTFTLQDPAQGASVSGTIVLDGQAGSTWVNVACYFNGTKECADASPSGGAWKLSLDTTKLPNGADTVQVMAFSVPAGQPGGSTATINLSLNVGGGGTPPPPPGGPTPSINVPGGVVALTFDDEFQNVSTDLSDSNTAVSGAKWYTQSVGCCYGQIRSKIGQTNSSYSQIVGGGLGITYTWPTPAGQGGSLSTLAPDASGGFTQTYGYYEAKIQQPPGTGSWPAWWMQNLKDENSFANTPSNFLPPGATGDYEIDMFETYGGTGSDTGNNIAEFTLHDYPIGGSQQTSGVAAKTPSSLSVGYHIYSMLWNSSTITFWIDGVQYFSGPTFPFMHSPGYMMLDQGNNSPWHLSGAQVTQPATLKIQYVRVWSVNP